MNWMKQTLYFLPFLCNIVAMKSASQNFFVLGSGSYTRKLILNNAGLLRRVGDKITWVLYFKFWNIHNPYWIVFIKWYNPSNTIFIIILIWDDRSLKIHFVLIGYNYLVVKADIDEYAIGNREDASQVNDLVSSEPNIYWYEYLRWCIALHIWFGKFRTIYWYNCTYNSS
jgi:hypothetical protein